MKFREFIISEDIFGFEKRVKKEKNVSDKPINVFDIELMVKLLSQKPINKIYPRSKFHNEITWGIGPGSVKLEIDPGYTFFIKRLIPDKEGNNLWITKKMFQLSRKGHGGYEDIIAQDIFEHIKSIFQERLDSPGRIKNLQNLVTHLYNRVKIHAKSIFIPEGIKKIDDKTYILCFGIRGHGIEAPSQRRVEQNQTIVKYIPERGVIHVFNYNIESPTGRKHEWKIMEKDLDIYFMPSQSKEEISKCLVVHYKFY